MSRTKAARKTRYSVTISYDTGLYDYLLLW